LIQEPATGQIGCLRRKKLDRFSFLAEGMAFQDLTQTSNDETVQKLPQVSFFANPNAPREPTLLWTSLILCQLLEGAGTKAHRIDLFP